MAKTYYNYAERQADAFVDWGKIGRDLTKMLQDENKIREDKKAALDKASSEFGQVLANAPQGENKELNQWALEYASDAQQARLLQDKLLKSGRLSVKDYTVMRQNINDGTTQLFGLIKTYQERQKIVMDRFRKNESSKLELYQWQQAEEFGDFSKSKPYINPTDFRVNLGQKIKKVVDGKEVDVMDPYPDKYATVNSVLNRINTNYDRYDITKGIKALVDTFGSEISVVQELATLYKTGSIKETLDVTKKSNLPADAQGIIMKFEDVETKLLQGILQDKFKAASVLTDSIGIADNGKEYDFTMDENEAKNNPNLIYLKTDPRGGTVPLLSEEQNKVALDRLRVEARMQYDKKETSKETPKIQPKVVRGPAPKPKAPKELEKEEQAQNFGMMIAYAVSGDAAQKTEAGDYFKAISGIGALDFKEEGIDVYKGGSAFPYSYSTDGVDKTSEGLGRSMIKALNTLNLPEDVIIKSMQDYIVSPNVSKIGVGRFGKVSMDYESDIGSYASKNVPNAVKTNNPKETVKNLKELFEPLGYDFRGETRGLLRDDILIVTAPNGKVEEFNIDTNKNNSEIINFIRKNRDDEKAEASGIFDKRLNTKPAAQKPKVQTTVTGGTPR